MRTRKALAVALVVLLLTISTAVSLKWEASEHRSIFRAAKGPDGRTLPGECGANGLFINTPPLASDFSNAVNNPLTGSEPITPFGVFIAMFGDLIGDPKLLINPAQCSGAHVIPTFQTFWDRSNILAVNDRREQIVSGQEVIRDELQHFAQKSNTPDEMFQSFPDPNLGPWARIGLLATRNMDHFEQHNCARNSLSQTISIFNAERSKANPDENRAMGALAYAFHYWSDMFASGHRRVPRDTLFNTLEAVVSVKAGGLSKMAHDEDNFNGLKMTFKGQSFTCYGDKHFFTPRNAKCREALATEACNILNKAKSGQMLSLTDFPFPAVDSQQSTCPLFIVEDGEQVRSREGTFSADGRQNIESDCTVEKHGCTYCKFNGCTPILPFHDIVYSDNANVDQVPLRPSETATAVLKPLECRVVSAVDELRRRVENQPLPGLRLSDEQIEKAKEMAREAERRLREGVDDLTRRGGEAVDRLKTRGGEAIDHLRSEGGEAIDRVRKEGGEAVDRLKKEGGEAIDRLKKEGSDLRDRASNKVDEISNSGPLKRVKNIMGITAPFEGEESGEPCDCSKIDAGIYKGSQDEPCQAWENDGKPWCYVKSSKKCDVGKIGSFEGRRWRECVPGHEGIFSREPKEKGVLDRIRGLWSLLETNEVRARLKTNERSRVRTKKPALGESCGGYGGLGEDAVCMDTNQCQGCTFDHRTSVSATCARLGCVGPAHITCCSPSAIAAATGEKPDDSGDQLQPSDEQGHQGADQGQDQQDQQGQQGAEQGEATSERTTTSHRRMESITVRRGVTTCKGECKSTMAECRGVVMLDDVCGSGGFCCASEGSKANEAKQSMSAMNALWKGVGYSNIEV